MRTWQTVLVICLVGVISLTSGWWIAHRGSPSTGVPVRTVADYLHAVIQADRTFYTQHVVERMEAMLIVTASERWREQRTLPLPAQFLQETADSLQTRGEPFRYRLVSLWPINPAHAPVDDRHARALERVMERGEVAEDYRTIEGQRFFQAIYPDRAVSPACVSCHNAHPKSPKRDFKLNDVMGGLEILIPIESSGS